MSSTLLQRRVRRWLQLSFGANPEHINVYCVKIVYRESITSVSICTSRRSKCPSSLSIFLRR